jgi:hypothetical protein
MSISPPPIDPTDQSKGETKICPDCAETIRAQARKCRFCGRRFDDYSESQSRSGGFTNGIPIGEVGPGGRLRVSGRGVVAVTCIVLMVVAASFAAWSLLAHASAGRQTVTGTLSLTDSDSDYQNYPLGHYCSGENGYDDIADGTEVQIANQAGTILATGVLRGGTGNLDSCDFTFSVPGVPTASFYQIEVSHRGNVTFSKAQLERNHWEADLTLGS